MEYYRNQYRSNSLRLKNYDYGSDGDYFLTICTKDRESFFGEIKNEKLQLSDEGKIAERIWQQIPENFPQCILNDFIIMPNHVHGILTIDNSLILNSRDAINRVSTESGRTGGITGSMNPMNKSGSIPYIVRWFKGRVSFEVRKITPHFG